jgi:hypothetical protein
MAGRMPARRHRRSRVLWDDRVDRRRGAVRPHAGHLLRDVRQPAPPRRDRRPAAIAGPGPPLRARGGAQDRGGHRDADRPLPACRQAPRRRGTRTPRRSDTPARLAFLRRRSLPCRAPRMPFAPGLVRSSPKMNLDGHVVHHSRAGHHTREGAAAPAHGRPQLGLAQPDHAGYRSTATAIPTRWPTVVRSVSSWPSCAARTTSWPPACCTMSSRTPGPDPRDLRAVR